MKQNTLLEIGEALKEHRLNAKLSLEQISKELKIRKSYLKAIEAGNAKILKFDAYTIGYIKQYAVLLGLDPLPYIKSLSQNSPTKKLASGKSKNLITGLEFLPSKKLILTASA